ncbi:MAG: trypsin-like serine protease [Gammaproteobacteria bacterium]|nr:trypsin-like serine protease [Gammaproteobacteria bacterium]
MFRSPIVWPPILLFVVLVFLLLPGVLRHLSQDVAQSGLDSSLDASLDSRIRQLETTLELQQCRPRNFATPLIDPESEVSEQESATPSLPVDPARTYLPDGRVPGGEEPDGQRNGVEGDDAHTPDVGTQNDNPESDAEISPPMDSDNSGEDAVREERETLLSLIEASTVLILSGNSTGTGFAIAPDRILTNSHVIGTENAVGDVVHVTNESLGRVVRTTVVAKTTDIAFGKPDFALLKLPEGTTLTPFTLTSSSSKLQNVIAAGFPGVVIQSDAHFRDLQNGDITSVPDLVLTSGAIMSKQPNEPWGTTVLHQASVSPGNSGGPLIDECGRVIAVNTFVLGEDDSGADRIHYSLGVDMVLDFIRAKGMNSDPVGGICRTGGAMN